MTTVLVMMLFGAAGGRGAVRRSKRRIRSICTIAVDAIAQLGGGSARQVALGGTEPIDASISARRVIQNGFPD